MDHSEIIQAQVWITLNKFRHNQQFEVVPDQFGTNLWEWGNAEIQGKRRGKREEIGAIIKQSPKKVNEAVKIYLRDKQALH